jgi:hypothetical protein
LCPQPSGLEGAHGKVTGKLKVLTATHLQSQAVRTAGKSSRRGKDTIETMGLSGQSLAEEGVAVMRPRLCVAGTKGGGHQIQPRAFAVCVPGVQGSNICHDTQAAPELPMDLYASTLHPEAVAGSDVGPRRVVCDGNIEAGVQLLSRSWFLSARDNSGHHADARKEYRSVN